MGVHGLLYGSPVDSLPKGIGDGAVKALAAASAIASPVDSLPKGIGDL